MCVFSGETEPAAAHRRSARPPQSAAKAAAAPSPKRNIDIFEKRWDHAVGIAMDYPRMFAAWKGRSWREDAVVVTDDMAEERWFSMPLVHQVSSSASSSGAGAVASVPATATSSNDIPPPPAPQQEPEISEVPPPPETPPPSSWEGVGPYPPQSKTTSCANLP